MARRAYSKSRIPSGRRGYSNARFQSPACDLATTDCAVSAMDGRRYPPPYPLFPYIEEAPEGLLDIGKIVWSYRYDVPKFVLSPLTKFLTARFRWMVENPGRARRYYRCASTARPPSSETPWVHSFLCHGQFPFSAKCAHCECLI